jgi:hypothetical protein
MSGVVGGVPYVQNPATSRTDAHTACHCEHLIGAWQSPWKRRDCFVSLAMTIFIAGFRYVFFRIANATP